MVVALVADGAAKPVMDPATAASSSRFHCMQPSSKFLQSGLMLLQGVFHCCQPVLKTCNACVERLSLAGGALHSLLKLFNAGVEGLNSDSRLRALKLTLLGWSLG
jgi:hypothetical protein